MTLESPSRVITSAGTREQSKNRSLLSRFTSPFAGKSKSISEFHIQLDEPHRRYSPGETVKGSVSLAIVKPVRVSHLVVCLHGYVKVYRNPNSPGKERVSRNGHIPENGRVRSGVEYTGLGTVSIFKDETVLCGEGRLKEGVYEFKFELEFPSQALPSSIDFERGTISYLITATLTRPTTISPTASCDRKIFLVETIDIAPLCRTKLRTISLEPISKRIKTRDKALSAHSSQRDELSHVSQSSSLSDNATSHQSDVLGHLEHPPCSPTASDVSSLSAVSNSTGSFRIVTDGSIPNLGNAGNAGTASTVNTRISSNCLANKTITATTYVMCAAGLPGDTLPIKVVVNHTKPVKSMLGVIVTLYRQGRIDPHPIFLPGDPHKGKPTKKYDYDDDLPKSKTGLSGLSLTSTGTNSTFRKDMSQTVAPLIVNPQTLKTEVKTSVRIPASAFPTIAYTPGRMISFKYYVEIILDLRGKLARQDRLLQRWGMSIPTTYGNESMVVNRIEDDGAQSMSAWNGVMYDTESIRRDKSVVACAFEVVVGTRDSAREENRKLDRVREDRRAARYEAMHMAEEQMPPPNTGQPPESFDVGDHEHYSAQDDEAWSYVNPPAGEYPFTDPRVLDTGPVDEKTRLRQHEELLLPSQPPPVATDSASSPNDMSNEVPSAPAEAELYGPPEPYYAEAGPSSRVPMAGFASSTDTVTPNMSTTRQAILPAASSNAFRDDKQELERQRLLAEVSSPPAPTSHDGPASVAAAHYPSAPVLLDEDEQPDADHCRDGTFSSENPDVLPEYRK